jgi:CRP-like cAMP-binding protein
LTGGELGRVYQDGEIIIRQGDVGDCMYVLQKGRAEIVVEKDGKEMRLRVAETGEILGEMAVFENQVRSATVRALGAARVLTIDKKNFLRRIHEDPTIAFHIVEIMARRIRELSEEVVRLRERD